MWLLISNNKKIGGDKKKMEKEDAIVVVHTQKDFCEKGSLEVYKADEIVPIINDLLPKFTTRIGTQDWHPKNHISFKPPKQGGAGWPIHCVAGTEGAKFHPRLKDELFTAIIRNATTKDKDAYSVFEDTGLEGLLKSLGIKNVFVCGLALEYCVKATALDAAKAGFKTFVILPAVRSISENPKEIMAIYKELIEARVNLIGKKTVTLL
jgi:nicotinamidase/pyrazinamidase